MKPTNDATANIRITREILNELKFHKRRSGVDAFLLLKKEKNLPDGLNPALVRGWLNTSKKFARKQHLDFVLNIWKSLPSSPVPYTKGRSKNVPHMMAGNIEITEDMRQMLLKLKDDTGIGAQRLIQSDSDTPAGLSAGTINNWLTGAVATAQEIHYEYVLEKWSQHRERGDSIVITSEIRQRLVAYRELTFLPGEIFLDAVDIPTGLNPAVISGWLSGKTLRAQKASLEYVFAKCRSLENAEDRKIKITNDMCAMLLAQRERTGFGAKVFLDRLDDIPPGLTASMIASWMSGSVTTVRKHFWDYVLINWQKIPANSLN